MNDGWGESADRFFDYQNEKSTENKIKELEEENRELKEKNENILRVLDKIVDDNCDTCDPDMRKSFCNPVDCNYYEARICTCKPIREVMDNE